ncbi:MAG: CopD family protein [Gammaproteobacteria bacterium]|nr:CopD family protein [Gammaproteobacteria bacterium]
MSIALFLHILAAVIWVGGMFFAHVVLRPIAAGQLEPPVRLTLWVGVFKRFFPLVFAAIATLLVTGYWMILSFYGGFDAVGLHVHIMIWTGYVMMLIFFHVFFAPFKRLKRAVAAEDWASGGKSLAQIRSLVGVNLLIGLAIIAIASGGRYLLA